MQVQNFPNGDHAASLWQVPKTNIYMHPMGSKGLPGSVGFKSFVFKPGIRLIQHSSLMAQCP